jgi:hypothetical protein
LNTFGDLLKWRIEKSFHARGLLGADYFLSGSMNLTLSGISINGEHLVFRTDPAAVAEQAIELELRQALPALLQRLRAHVLPVHLHHVVGDQDRRYFALARAQAVKVGRIIGPQNNRFVVDDRFIDRQRGYGIANAGE